MTQGGNLPVVINSLYPADIIKTTLYCFKTQKEETMEVPASIMHYGVDRLVLTKEKWRRIGYCSWHTARK